MRAVCSARLGTILASRELLRDAMLSHSEMVLPRGVHTNACRECIKGCSGMDTVFLHL